MMDREYGELFLDFIILGDIAFVRRNSLQILRIYELYPVVKLEYQWYNFV